MLKSVFFIVYRGENFRKDFMDLSTLKALFLQALTMFLTAKAPPIQINEMIQTFVEQKQEVSSSINKPFKTSFY